MAQKEFVRPLVYVKNKNLGIYIEDEELDSIVDKQKAYESHLSDGSLPFDSIEYTAEIDEDVDNEIPEGAISYEDYCQSFSDDPLSFYCLKTHPIFSYAGEVNSGEMVTETEGYIPLIRRIQDLERAGTVLKNYRTSIYDGHDVGDEDVPLNPFATPGVDITDIDAEIKKAKKTIADANSLLAKYYSEQASVKSVAPSAADSSKKNGQVDGASLS